MARKRKEKQESQRKDLSALEKSLSKAQGDLAKAENAVAERNAAVERLLEAIENEKTLRLADIGRVFSEACEAEGITADVETALKAVAKLDDAGFFVELACPSSNVGDDAQNEMDVSEMVEEARDSPSSMDIAENEESGPDRWGWSR